MANKSDANENLKNLMGRNQTYARDPVFAHDRMEANKAGSKKTIIVSCPDPRVVLPFIFLTRIGEIIPLPCFGVEVTEYILDQIRFAIEENPDADIIVMGHNDCAWHKKLAKEGKIEDATIRSYLELYPKRIREVADMNAQKAVKRGVNAIIRIVPPNICVAGAFYNVETGEVEMF